MPESTKVEHVAAATELASLPPVKRTGRNLPPEPEVQEP